MKVKRTQDSQKTSSSKRKNISFQVIALLVVAIMALLFFFWHQKNFRGVTDSTEIYENKEDFLAEEISIPEPIVSTGFPEEVLQAPVSPGISPSASHVPSKIIPGNDDTGRVSDSLEEGNTGDETPASHVHENTHHLSASAAAACEAAAREIREFYRHLDRQEYLRTYDFNPDSEAHFTALIQKLLKNPPVVSGETDDLYTILQNTAHFFRIIGNDNILALKAILDREQDRFENVLSEFYSLLHIPSCPELSFNLEVTPASLYDYAGFFLNTMGGRLYLFRRDSMSRMVVSYYAIMLIDQANKNASNQHGIELRGAIDQLIGEIESTANVLQMKDAYLDSLYSLKEEYQ